MEEEFYFEETNPRKSFIAFICMIIAIIIIAVLVIIYMNGYNFKLKRVVEYEVGSNLVDNPSYYIKGKVNDEDKYKLNFRGVALKDNVLNKVGEYQYKVTKNKVSKKGIIKVVDTTPPKVDVKNFVIGLNEEFEEDDLIENCSDYSMPCRIKFKKESDENITKKAGVYNVDIVVSDAYDNKVTKSVTITVKKNYSRTSEFKKDLKADHISPEYDDWKGKMLIKYDQAMYPDDIDASNEKYEELQEILGSDLHNYIDPLYYNNQIMESQIIEVYNKYNYIVGFAVRIKLDNGLYLYLTK